MDIDNTKPNARDMMMVNLKNLLNEAYAKDKSKRICSAFDAKRANGEFNVKYAPYGYLISGDKKSPYKVDPEAAPVIREIFDLREQGMSILSIARLMDEKGYLTPIQYALKKGIRKKANGDNHWTSVTIDRILNNPAYLGHMYMRQTETRLYQGIKRRKVDKKDQFIVKNVNEPIVSQEQFDMVHSMKRTYEKKKKSSKAADNVLKGFLYCAECGKLLFRNHSHSSNGKTINYFSCPTYRDHLDKYCTHKAGMREDEIKAVILEFIKSQARLAGQIELRANAALELDMAKNRTSNKNTVISELKAAIEREEYLARDAFECYVLGSIAEDEYMCQKEKHESEKRQLQERLKKAEKSTSKGLVEAVKSNSYVQLLKTLTRARTVTREMCEALLERIDIDKDHNVKITVKYRDEFADFLKTIKETEAELKDVG